MLGIIPARGGSKGLPRKNILSLCGKPLIAWTILQASASQRLTRVIVSSDSPEIVEIARRFGGDVPFLRPEQYAKDETSASDVIIHALTFLKEHGEIYDFVAWLEPTSPLRKPEDIDNAISSLLVRPDCDSVVSIGKVHMEHPRLFKQVKSEFVSSFLPGSEAIYRRQQLESVYLHAGSPLGEEYFLAVYPTVA